jgi:hypothetical protein
MGRWHGWINSILSTGTSAVILNGVLGRKFKSRRGVRQGDPLSPLIFVPKLTIYTQAQEQRHPNQMTEQYQIKYNYYKDNLKDLSL